ncbi:Ribonuclease H-like domain containing protein [Trema orientale]|uniref:Ribonuclease H-like domain containing protein n=1 Tax=Trema orientale TaxID=63057 RepID=A0A2P5AD55_TREOI|nr:Ribonuclease H-like domain containing protein [Trema orientale]
MHTNGADKGRWREQRRDPNQVTIHVDAALQQGRGSVAAIARGENSQILRMEVLTFKASSPEEAEGKAIELGINMARQQNWEDCVILSDNLEWVKAIQSNRAHCCNT